MRDLTSAEHAGKVRSRDITGPGKKDGAGLRAVPCAILRENPAVQGIPLPGPYAALSIEQSPRHRN